METETETNMKICMYIIEILLVVCATCCYIIIIFVNPFLVLLIIICPSNTLIINLKGYNRDCIKI